MLELFPGKPPSRIVLPVKTSPEIVARARVALVAGCAQSVLEPEIGTATISVLVRNGVEVVVPSEQSCCGALHWHSGEGERARDLARNNLDAFTEDVDAIISNAAGCGSCLQEYPLVLKGDAREKEAKRFSAKVCDFSVFLDDIGIHGIPPATGPIRVVYQDACHLLHAQGVFDSPRKILRAVPGVELVEIEDSEICCGSAGLYNIEEPEIASELGRNKANQILAANPDVVVSANIGCLVQLRHHLRNAENSPRILHLAVFLELAYSGDLGS